MPTLDKMKGTQYSQTPEDMASQLDALLAAGSYMVGGCCGTGPEHIAAFREALDRR